LLGMKININQFKLTTYDTQQHNNITNNNKPQKIKEIKEIKRNKKKKTNCFVVMEF